MPPLAAAAPTPMHLSLIPVKPAETVARSVRMEACRAGSSPVRNQHVARRPGADEAPPALHFLARDRFPNSWKRQGLLRCGSRFLCHSELALFAEPGCASASTTGKTVLEMPHPAAKGGEFSKSTAFLRKRPCLGDGCGRKLGFQSALGLAMANTGDSLAIKRVRRMPALASVANAGRWSTARVFSCEDVNAGSNRDFVDLTPMPSDECVNLRLAMVDLAVEGSVCSHPVPRPLFGFGAFL